MADPEALYWAVPCRKCRKLIALVKAPGPNSGGLIKGATGGSRRKVCPFCKFRATYRPAEFQLGAFNL